MTDYSAFKLIKYNVTSLEEDEQVLDHWPELREVNAYNLGFTVPQDNVLRYIFLFYDPKTPLLKHFNNPKKAKREAAVMAGFKPRKKGGFNKDVNLMLLGKNKKVNQAIMQFLIDSKQMPWATFHAVFQRQITNMWELNNDSETKLTIKGVIEDGELLNVMLLEFLNQDSTKGLSEEAFAYADAEIEIRPENLADKIEDGDMIVDIKPYIDE